MAVIFVLLYWRPGVKKVLIQEVKRSGYIPKKKKRIRFPVQGIVKSRLCGSIGSWKVVWLMSIEESLEQLGDSYMIVLHRIFCWYWGLCDFDLWACPPFFSLSELRELCTNFGFSPANFLIKEHHFLIYKYTKQYQYNNQRKNEETPERGSWGRHNCCLCFSW